MKKSLLALTLLAALPFAASAADGVSYNYVEGGYIANDALDSDGWAINGSGAIATPARRPTTSTSAACSSKASMSTRCASAWVTTTRSPRAPTW